jgi:hypothetical protein
MSTRHIRDELLPPSMNGMEASVALAEEGNLLTAEMFWF